VTHPELHIAFEGPIGVGKTTHARGLANHLGVDSLLEDHESKVFLALFYADNSRWALAMQLEFLADRYQQLRDAQRWHHNVLVADHTFSKDRLFADMLLSGAELQLYSKFHDLLPDDVAKPDIIVLLDAPTDVLLSRIRARARPMELELAGETLDLQRDAYERYVEQHYATRHIRVATDKVNLGDAASLGELYESILDAGGNY